MSDIEELLGKLRISWRGQVKRYMEMRMGDWSEIQEEHILECKEEWRGFGTV
jgi:hypothetical protein